MERRRAELDLTITNLPQYHGTAKFKGGTITIQNHLPMWGDFKAGSSWMARTCTCRASTSTPTAPRRRRRATWISRTGPTCVDVKSRVHFPRMREIFFTDEKWRLTGDGDFTGMFRLYDRGHNLSGTFTSPNAGLNDLVPGLDGALQWNEHGFDVWNAGSKFYGGDAKFQYSIKPFGEPMQTTQRFDVHVRAHRSRAVHGFRADAEGPALCRRRRRARVSRVAVGKIPRAPRRRQFRRRPRRQVSR